MFFYVLTIFFLVILYLSLSHKFIIIKVREDNFLNFAFRIKCISNFDFRLKFTTETVKP